MTKNELKELEKFVKQYSYNNELKDIYIFKRSFRPKTKYE